VAVTRYKFDDFTPHAFKTSDYGRSWTRITTGIPEESWVRVVREDPKRRGLLYMGTETGVYVSFDDGESWQALQLNLPVTPITDLKVQAEANDLVAATSGRSFWILDDLSPLQQIDGDVEAAAVHLFAPRPATRVQRGFSFGSNPRAGENPPEGAILDFVLDEVSEDTEVTLEILDGAGDVIRTYPPEEREGGSGDGWAPKAGMNRVSWDLRHERPTVVPGLYIFGSLRGRLAVPGTYRVRLTVGEEVRTQSLEVRRDPRLDTPLETYREQDRLLAEIAADISAIHGSVNRLRAVRSQIEGFIERAKDREGGEAVAEAGESLVERLNAVEDALVQKRTVDGQTVINFPVQLNHHFIYLYDAVDGSDSGVIEGARDLYADLQAQWREHEATLGELLGAELDGFNALVRENGIPTIVAPEHP
jgi:hypothetical protein